MTIGFDASRAFTKEATGTENYSWQILKNLLAIDSENQYYIYIREDFKKTEFEPGKNVKIIPIKFSRLWTQAGLALRTFQDPIDILFVPGHTLPIIRRPGLKTVMTIHDLGSEYLPNLHQLKQRLYLNFITHYQLKTADHLIAVSESTKKDLIDKISIPSKKISVVYEGVEVISVNEGKIDQTLRKFDLKKKSYFLFIGTIQPRKNLIRLIESFSLFLIENREQQSECKLVIAGKPGWDFEEIMALPGKLGIESEVKFVGRVDDEEATALYKEAIALTYPSLFEGFGLPILEAYAHNCPVITSNTSSMPEVAGKGAILVNPKQVHAIMEAMQKIYRNNDLRSQLVRHGREQLAKFSWEKAAEETLKILEKTVREE